MLEGTILHIGSFKSLSSQCLGYSPPQARQGPAGDMPPKYQSLEARFFCSLFIGLFSRFA